MTQEDLQRDMVTLDSLHRTCLVNAKRTRNPDMEARLRTEAAALDRAIERARVLASMSEEQVDAMLVQTGNLATSWAGARDAALTDVEYERCDVLACGYAALAASLTALRRT